MENEPIKKDEIAEGENEAGEVKANAVGDASAADAGVGEFNPETVKPEGESAKAEQESAKAEAKPETDENEEEEIKRIMENCKGKSKEQKRRILKGAGIAVAALLLLAGGAMGLKMNKEWNDFKKSGSDRRKLFLGNKK